MNKGVINAYANNDQVIIVWDYSEPIDNCIGFALYKKLEGQSDLLAEPVHNKVGFAGQETTTGEQRPSTEWPVQRFTWTDFAVSTGDIVYYKVVPILIDATANKLTKDEADSTDWAGPVMVNSGDKYQAFFNRGIISSQFFNHMRTEFAAQLSGTSVKSIIGGKSNPVRDFLGGYLSKKLFELLDGIINDKSLTVYGALYELQQNDLIDKLKQIGSRANIILSNGAFKTKGGDENEATREELKAAGVNVIDRIVDLGHFAHNKFLVIAENDVKKHVWTGSTNWTPGGLFSQVNNGLYMIDNSDMANAYYTEWEKLKAAGNSSADPALLDTNKNALPGNDYPKVWFSPKQKTDDLTEANALMNKAEKGILFLMFNPGPSGTLFNTILDIQKQKPDLFVHGVINQDPGGRNPLIFFHKGSQSQANWDDILPDKIGQQMGFFDTEMSGGLVTIHSKVVVIDPFTDHGCIITGSSNMGPKASTKNDDNFNILTDKKLVEEYAVHILGVYDHYRWRYSVSNADPTFNGLSRDPKWMQQYLNSGRAFDLKNFWFK